MMIASRRGLSDSVIAFTAEVSIESLRYVLKSKASPLKLNILSLESFESSASFTAASTSFEVSRLFP